MSETDTVLAAAIKRSLRLLRSDDPQQRMKGIGGLAALHDDLRVSQVFERLYESDPDPRVRRAAWYALYQNGPSVPAPRPAPEPVQPTATPVPTTIAQFSTPLPTQSPPETVRVGAGANADDDGAVTGTTRTVVLAIAVTVILGAVSATGALAGYIAYRIFRA